jgi:hypothetical protein
VCLSFFTNGVLVAKSFSAAALETQLISLLVIKRVLHRKINSLWNLTCRYQSRGATIWLRE